MTRMVYDDGGNVIETITLEENHDEAGSDVGVDMSNDDDYVQTAVYSWYDDAGRLTATADYGTSNE